MTAETHPDPFQDAMGHGLQRAVQVASCAVTAAQVYLYQQRTQARAAAERDERARRALTAQIRADREAARVGWAPALDPDWLRQADLFQTAARLGRGDAVRRPVGALVRAGRRDGHAQMRGTAPRPAPLRHGPLRPAARRRHGPGRGDARGRAAVRRPAPGIRRAVHASARAGRRDRRKPDLDHSRPRARPRRTHGPGSGRSAGTTRQTDPRRIAGTGPRSSTAVRSARPSSAPSWRPSPTCPPTSSTGSCVPTARPKPPGPRISPQRYMSPPPRADQRPARGNTTSPCRSRKSSPPPPATAPERPAVTSTRARRRSLGHRPWP